MIEILHRKQFGSAKSILKNPSDISEFEKELVIRVIERRLISSTDSNNISLAIAALMVAVIALFRSKILEFNTAK